MQSRIERLEARVRRLGAAVAVLVGALVILVGYGATRPVPEVIRARSFEVLNEEGGVDAVLFTGGMGGHLRLNFPAISEPAADLPRRLDLGFDGLAVIQGGTHPTELHCIGGRAAPECERLATQFSAKKIGNKFFYDLEREIFRLGWQDTGGELVLFNTKGEEAAHLYSTGSGGGNLLVGDGKGGLREFNTDVP